MSDNIIIDELEVNFRVGVPAEERAKPQRLLVCVQMDLDTGPAAASDDLARTVDYYELTESIKRLGHDREWKLIETLAHDIASLVLANEIVEKVVVEIRKFILPDTRFVAVQVCLP